MLMNFWRTWVPWLSKANAVSLFNIKSNKSFFSSFEEIISIKFCKGWVPNELFAMSTKFFWIRFNIEILCWMFEIWMSFWIK